MKQVDKSHYEFHKYMDKRRWSSVWHQIDEVIRLNPRSVLEIGPGAGVFKNTAYLFGVKVETLDLDPELMPDYVGSATALPFGDGTFDVVCAFQMLEHLPYESALVAFKEMARVSRKDIVISLPDSKAVWRYSLQVPKFGDFKFLFPKPFAKPRVHEFDGEHHWEVGKKDYSLEKVIADFSAVCPLASTYRVHDNPYHRFFIFKTTP
jgi:ubiquinone/menaquinone biosynthesis C-methylase UbiE